MGYRRWELVQSVIGGGNLRGAVVGMVRQMGGVLGDILGWKTSRGGLVGGIEDGLVGGDGNLVW